MKRYKKLHMEVIEVEPTQMLAASDTVRLLGGRTSTDNGRTKAWGNIWE